MSWPLVKLEDLVEINIGRTPSRNNPQYWGEGVPWLSIRDMNQGKNFASTAEQITSLAIEETKCKVAKKGTVLFSFKLSIGKVGFAGLDMFHNEAIAAMPIKEGVKLCEEYLYFALLQLDSTKGTDRAVMGATLNKKKMAELKIPLPPLETQKQIAAVLEKADQLRKDCKLMEQELNSLAQSVFIDMFGDPVTNPKGWSRQKLGEVLSINHGYAFKSEFFTTQGDYVLLTPGNFYEEGGYWDRAEKQKYYSGAIPDGYVLEKDDLLLAMTEQAAGLLGSAILIPESNKYLHNQRLGLVRFKDLNQNSVFYAYLFNNKSVRLAIHSLATGTKVRHTSPTKLEAIEVGIPPCDLQKKFEVIIHSIDQKLKLNSKAKLEFELSFNALMQKAFKGELNLKTKAA